MIFDFLWTVIVIAITFFLLWRLSRFEKRQDQMHDILLQQQARFGDQERRAENLHAQIEARTRQFEADLRALDSHLGARQQEAQQAQQAALFQFQELLLQRFGELRENLERRFGESQTHFEMRQGEALKALQDSLRAGMEMVQRQVVQALATNAEELGKRVEGLTQTTDKRLQEISGQVEKRLSEGFEKTTATFVSVLERLALIDEAQKKITELSGNVVSLQDVLTDKRSRGAFGEVQLVSLLRNVLPEKSYAVQYSLSNGNRVDCILFLPEPTGNVPIDAKFPLENYRRMIDSELAEAERKGAEKQFKSDIRKHINDISSKYIVPGYTSDGAVMFIPAEAIFAEIHARHPDLVEEAQRARVWLCSPTTLMAILSTARAVLKDAATRQQVHIIQEHLSGLSKDFRLFQKRMEALAQHIRQANEDMDDVGVSARKLSKRFQKIEAVELEDESPPQLNLVQAEVTEE